jgi:hypothetical protein
LEQEQQSIVQNRSQLNLGRIFHERLKVAEPDPNLVHGSPKNTGGIENELLSGGAQGLFESPSIPSRRHRNILKDPLNCEGILIFL